MKFLYVFILFFSSVGCVFADHGNLSLEEMK